MLPAPATRAVICSAAPLPYPADAGTPRQTGPRRLIASSPAAGATQASLRRPGALKITASCGREPVAPVTLTAVLVPGPQYQRSARASRSRILHATPLTSLKSQSGGVAAHPPHMLAPSVPGGCARAPAACAARQRATSSQPDTAGSRRHRRHPHHPRRNPPSARLQADSDRAVMPAGIPQAGHTSRG